MFLLPALDIRVFYHLASFSLALGVLFTSLFTREFVKLRIGPLYVLEALFFLASFLLLPSIQKTRWKESKVPFLFLLCFVAYGFLRLAMDFVLPNSHTAEEAPLLRTLQYALLFVYPLLWVFIGYLQNQADPTYSKVIVYSVLVTTLPNFVGSRAIHLSLGPLMVVPLFYLATRITADKKNLLEKVESYLLLSALFLLTFIPFWKMWLTHMQRTNFLMLVIAVFTLPFVIRSPRYGRGKALKILASICVAAILGGGLYSVSTQCDLEQSLRAYSLGKSNYLACAENYFTLKGSFIPSSFQKGDDATSDPSAPIQLKFRSRGYMWENAWNHWKEHPVWGNGFRMEIPSFLREGYPNIVGSVESGDGPVTGPHNSYLQILARMGVIGLTLFLAWVASLFLSFKTYFNTQERTSLEDLLLATVIFNGFFYAIVNVGFESPHVAFPIWLFTGILLSKGSHGIRSAN